MKKQTNKKLRKTFIEILAGVAFVLIGTLLVYTFVEDFAAFWQSQFVWSVILIILWTVVSLGYFHQGWLVFRSGSADHVSVILPAVVFLVQCVLFVKGVYYEDWSLIAGALLVNSGVVFSLYQIITHRRSAL
ncbi:MAG: hypothetical protein WD049_04660 [Candidatus Paceibacterota bacterium]